MANKLITEIEPRGFKALGLAPEVFGPLAANNQARLAELRGQASPAMMAVFDLVPDILHGLPVGPPEYLAEGRTPTGLRFWGSPAEKRPHPNRLPALESLMLIGSSGSIGHTARSDLDYWLCYNTAVLTREKLNFFRRQLDLLTTWANREFGAEVNFYLVDLTNLAAGRLVGPCCGDDSEGQVAPLLLLEEFYRTALYVGGRLPLWWAVAAEAGPADYQRLALNLKRASAQSQARFLVDLGFPAPAGPQEHLAAALWLARKSEADPFKGVIKLMITLKQVETAFESPPLCLQLKNMVLRTPPESLPVDPYLLTITNVLNYGRKRLRADQLNLLEIAVFFKVRGLGRPGRPVRLGLHSTKYRVMRDLIKAWGWSRDKLEQLTAYECWPERAQLDLGEQIQEFSNELYSYIDRRLEADYPGQVDAQRGRLNQLAARMLTRQKGYEATVETLPSQLHRDAVPAALRLLYKAGGWGLYKAAPAGSGQGHAHSLIYHGARAARIAAWLVNNRLGGLNLETAPGPVEKRVFERLTAEISALWPPVNWAALNTENIWRPGAQGPRLLIVNLERPAPDGHLNELDFIYRTGWGEMRHLWLDLSGESLEADKFKLAAELVSQSGGRENLEGLEIFMAEEGPGGGKLRHNLRTAVAMALGPGLRRKQSPASGRRSRLDLT